MQGIDAPELHYQPSALTAKEKKGLSASKIEAYHSVDHFYRQPMGATTTKALHDLLASSSNASLQCRIFTQIDGPNEAFDTYGRLVGDIEITSDGNPLNLNDWLVENGWAFPTFYSSMTNDEINKILLLAKVARDKKRGVWKFLSNSIGPFDFTLLEPKKNETAVLIHDKGPVIFPKIYRRYTNWSARHKAKITVNLFKNFWLRDQTGSRTIVLKQAIFSQTAFIQQPIELSMNSSNPERK